MTVPLKARTLIADDHALMREGMKAVLDAQPDFEVVAEAADGAEAVRAALREELDLAVLDVSMPRMTGIHAAIEILRHRPAMKVLMLTMHESEQLFYDALQAGASGYVIKSAAGYDLVDAARAALRGELFLNSDMLRDLAATYLEALRRGEERPPHALTDRELEVLKLIAEGYGNQQIGEVLVISPKT
ncbi:MAG TPA: response regulator transcription factor, partial [Solirubrobacteraceae bacterium]|nr:response regulator transcription factor [Solirubrobacteraceae bacterium]